MPEKKKALPLSQGRTFSVWMNGYGLRKVNKARKKTGQSKSSYIAQAAIEKAERELGE